MPIIATLAAVTTKTSIPGLGPGVQLHPLDVSLSVSPPASPVGLAGIIEISDVADQLNPVGAAATVVQVVDITAETFIPGRGDVTIDTWAGPVEVEHSADGATWRVSVPAVTEEFPHGPMLWETDYGGCPVPGNSPFGLDVNYYIEGVPVPYRVLGDGAVSDSSERTIDDRGRHILEITGLGFEGRFDGKRVTFKLEANHGLTQGEMIRGLALEAGVPEIEIDVDSELGSPRDNPLDVIDEEWLPVAREIAESAGAWFGTSHNSRQFTTRPRAPTSEPEIIFTGREFLQRSGFGSNAVGEQLTSIVVEGSHVEPSDDGTGAITTVRKLQSFANFRVPNAEFSQSTIDGALLVTTPAGPLASKFQLVSEIEIRETKEAGCLIFKETITRGFFAPKAARYRLDVAGGHATYFNVYIYDAGAVADDATEAFSWQRFRFIETSRVTEVPVYDDDDREISRGIFHNLFLNRREAIKDRLLTSSTWESEPFRLVQVTGPGVGVTGLAERYYDGPLFGAGRPTDSPNGSFPSELFPGPIHAWAKVEDSTVSINNDNMKTAQSKAVEEFVVPTGDLFLFQGPVEEGRLAEEIGLVTSSENESFYPNPGDETHTSVKVVSNKDGKVSTEIDDLIDNYLPAATRCAANIIALNETRTFEVTVFKDPGPCLPSDGFPISNAFIEDEDEADSFGRLLLRESGTKTVRFAVVVNAALYYLMAVRFQGLIADLVGITGSGWIERVNHVRDDDGSFITEIEAKVVPE